MKMYTVKAQASVDLEIDVQATSEAHAKEIFEDHILLSASLVDLPESAFIVIYDSVSALENINAEAHP